MTVPLLVANIIAFTVQTTIIIATALMLLRALRLGVPTARYLLLRTLLLVCLLLPALAPRVPLAGTEDPAAAWLDGSRAALSLRSAPAATERRDGPAAAVQAGMASWWAPWLLSALVAGACVRLLWMAAGLIRLHGLRSAGESMPRTDDYEELQARIRARADVRLVADLGQPVTFGLLRPVVLLPFMLTTLPAGIQRAVLAHELWHVRRKDWIWVLTEELVRAAFWFHPAMWILVSRIQAAREEPVDQLAIRVTGSRRNYLDALVAFAERPPLFAAAAFARRRHLVHRMLMIAKENVMSPTRVLACSAAIVTVIAATGWYSVSAFPLTVPAQEPRDRMPPPPPPAPTQFGEKEAAMLQRVREQPNAQNYHALATLYFERASRERSLTLDEKSRLIAEGLAAADAALSFDADYMEALIYKNLLLRLQAELETRPGERARLIDEADRLRARAMELRKQQPMQAAPLPGTMPAPPPPPPPPPPGDEIRTDGLVDGEMPIRVGGNFAPPTKTRDVRPVYPPEAFSNRVSGVVIVEATIDREGRVRNARVLRSIPLLDAAAVEAVRQWEFTPTLLNGVPRPVIMTVTVNFVLE